MAYTGLVLNPNYVQTGIGIQVYLVPYVVPVGATLILKEQAILAEFFTSGITQAALMAGALPLGVFDHNGLALKVKGNTIEFNPMQGSKYPLAVSDYEGTVEGVIADIDSAHFQSLFGSTAGEFSSIAAGAGQTGQTITAFGNGKVLKQYSLMLRYPSVIVPVGSGTVTAFDCLVFPKVVIVPELDMKFAKKDPTTAKIQWTLVSDLNMLSPDNATPFLGFKVEVTAPAS